MTKFKILCLLGLAISAMAADDVQIKNLRLFVGNNEFFVKGMAYSPSPLEKIYDGQNDGKGLCMARPTYATGSHSSIQQISGCNTEDYFNSAKYSFGNPEGWFNVLWERDFPLIKQLGVNTIRIYHADPITQAAVDNGPYTDKTVPGSNHIPFMDAAQANGFKVVFPLFAESYALDVFDASYIQEYTRNLIDEVGNHPALLMFTFGNELQFSSRDQAYIDKVNTYIDYARAYQASKWGRKIVFTVALIDIPPWYNKLIGSTGLHVDVLTTNAGYRGFTFTDLWQSNLYPIACSTGIPSLIGEMGVHLDTPQFNVPGWFPAMWSDIIGHKTQGAIGGFYFSWSEEHWKGVVPGADWTKYPDVYMGVVSQTATSGFNADAVTKKYGTAYDWDGAVSGYAQDPFKQDPAQTLASAKANYCDGTFQVVPAIQPPVEAWKPDPTTPTTMPTPIAYFSMDSATGQKVSDLTGTGHDATLYGSPAFNTGVKGNALNLDGTQTAMVSGLNSVTGDMTIAMWIYLNVQPAAEAKLVSSKASWNDANGFEITLNPKTLKFVGAQDSVAEYDNLNIPTGSWTHIAFTVSASGTVNLYLNGIQAAAQKGVASVKPSSNSLFIGSAQDKEAFFTGAVDEVLFFNAIVGGDQMINLANQANLATFATAQGNANTGSTNGGSANTGSSNNGNTGNANTGSSNTGASTGASSGASSAGSSAGNTNGSSGNNGSSNGTTQSGNSNNGGGNSDIPETGVQRPQNSAGRAAVALGMIALAMFISL